MKAHCELEAGGVNQRTRTDVALCIQAFVVTPFIPDCTRGQCKSGILNKERQIEVSFKLG